MNLKFKIASGAILIALILIFWLGWHFGKTRVRCPQITNDTIFIHDTNWVVINDTTYYPLKPDTIIDVDTFLIDVDTNAILKKFFNQYGYEWEQKDSNIVINGYTSISQNTILKNDIKYKWLQPTTTVVNNLDNSIHYNKYLYAGLGVPFKNFNYINLELTYAFPKGYISGYWVPELKSFGAKAGVTLFKFE